jgi:Type II CAAX prenyl endopeptidase Rce1-like
MGSEAPRSDADARSALRKRGLVVLVFVGGWMALGWVLKLDANCYLLLGVPLTALFQLVVSRQPIRASWVRNAPPFRVSFTWALLTVAIAAYPVYDLFHSYQAGWVIICWMSCAILGAPAAAYSIQNFTRRAAGRSIWPSLGMLVVMSLLMVLGAVARHGMTVFTAAAWEEGVRSALRYVPVCFVLEEVTFRGALDAYLYRPGERRGTLSAAGLAFVWGLWHLPIVPQLTGTGLVPLALTLGIVHMAVGIPLALSWRTGGNLLVPAAAHGLLDAVRNALAVVK